MTDTTYTIQRTADYSQFKRIIGNRKPQTSHITRLVQSISQNPESSKYTPVIVNEKFEIVDGQHRFEADKILELPIYYIQVPGLGLKDVQALNSISKPWSPTDFAKAFDEIGNKHYSKYLEFKKEFKLNHDILLAYLGLDKAVDHNSFKSGKFKVTDEEASRDLCKKLIETGEFYDGYNRRSYALAFKTAWQHDKYDHSQMMRRLKLKGSEIQDYASQEDYLRDLEAIYNGNMRNGDRVRFF